MSHRFSGGVEGLRPASHMRPNSHSMYSETLKDRIQGYGNNTPPPPNVRSLAWDALVDVSGATGLATEWELEEKLNALYEVAKGTIGAVTGPLEIAGCKTTFPVGCGANDITRNLVPGAYRIGFRPAMVSETAALGGKSVGTLRGNSVVNVLQVVHRPFEKRMRGRIEDPDGWISLLDTRNGYLWAMWEAPLSEEAFQRSTELAVLGDDEDSTRIVSVLPEKGVRFCGEPSDKESHFLDPCRSVFFDPADNFPIHSDDGPEGLFGHRIEHLEVEVEVDTTEKLEPRGCSRASSPLRVDGVQPSVNSETESPRAPVSCTAVVPPPIDIRPPQPSASAAVSASSDLLSFNSDHKGDDVPAYLDSLFQISQGTFATWPTEQVSQGTFATWPNEKALREDGVRI
eukprot:TRINITY_DN34461_c0_g1_i1.p1 TRINITY_DN34461_c0_g1~~TRINITY_DN34461_c0_g1_i1.p1  ORF type:complete len:400 (+),score=62.61 TRINITY_DN34461_c0_g1_i1:42-1241(+)